MSGRAQSLAGTATTPSADPAPHLMSCMEVWGGNHSVDQGVVMPGLELWIHSEPHQGHSQGGDVHYVSSCGTGRISRMVLADVSGHGESAGDMARTLRRLMRQFVNFVDQTRFVRAMNASLHDDPSGNFATSVAMTFFAPSHRLDLCNAGHPRPFLFRARQRAWSVLSAEPPSPGRESSAPSNLPLGVLAPTEYAEFGLRLEPGDLVLAYTDALIETRRPDGAMLNEAGLLEMVRSLDASQPERIVPALVATLADLRRGEPPDDDLTVLLLRHTSRAERAGFLDRLMASLRFLGMLVRHAIPIGERPPIPWPEISRVNILGAFSRRVAESWDGPASKGRPPPS